MNDTAVCLWVAEKCLQSDCLHKQRCWYLDVRCYEFDSKCPIPNKRSDFDQKKYVELITDAILRDVLLRVAINKVSKVYKQFRRMTAKVRDLFISTAVSQLSVINCEVMGISWIQCLTGRFTDQAGEVNGMRTVVARPPKLVSLYFALISMRWRSQLRTVADQDTHLVPLAVIRIAAMASSNVTE